MLDARYLIVEGTGLGLIGFVFLALVGAEYCGKSCGHKRLR